MKKITVIIIAIITFVVALCACNDKGDGTTAETTTVSTTAEATTAETTTVSTTVTTTKMEVTEPVLQEGMEEISLSASKIPIKLEGVRYEKAVFHKASDQMVTEYSEYGDDPYVHNHLYIFVQGDSADLEITYISQYAGGVNSSAFYEDHQLIWHDGLGEKQLDISVEEEKATVRGFSSNLTEITNQARMFMEFMEIENVPVKLVTFVFI